MTAALNHPSYTIYLFEKSSDHRTPAWRRYRSVATLDEARREMKALYETGDYQQVEIKKQTFCRRRQRNVNSTIIVMNDDRSRVRSMARTFLSPWRGV